MNETKRHENQNRNRPAKKRINRRAIVSLTLLFSFILTFVSALVAHTAESFTVRHDWLHVHGYSGLTFTVASILHVVLNWRTLKKYLGIRVFNQL